MKSLVDCNRENLCVDCDDKVCTFHGKAMADCPKYDCENEPQYQCDKCEFMSEYQEKMREKYRKNGRKEDDI